MFSISIHQPREMGQVSSSKAAGWEIIDPLETVKALLERRYKEHKEDDIKTVLILLKLFETEINIKDYVKRTMTLCSVHGLCSRERAKDCSDYSAHMMVFEQDCDYCENQEEIE